MTYIKNCLNCDDEFETDNSLVEFCSEGCELLFGDDEFDDYEDA